ncbi:hypothetical protein O6H91_Y087200 [Diphasiastrum complanatum]|nr:hypothetical protein O6H91_Y087200 [Diphasiastrum complanatum]
MLVTIIRCLPLFSEYVLLPLRVMCIDVLPSIWRGTGAWLTPPFLFVIFNSMLVAILVPSGLFNLEKSDVADVSNVKQVQSGENVHRLPEVSQEMWQTQNPDAMWPTQSSNEMWPKQSSNEEERTSNEISNEMWPTQSSNVMWPPQSSNEMWQTQSSNEEEKASNEICSAANKDCPELLVDQPGSHEADSLDTEYVGSDIIESSDVTENLKIETKMASSPSIGHENVLCYELDDLHERIEAFIAHVREQMRLPEPYATKL